jgi:ABC-type nickel/cobalt efflux system permease component RcnA
MRHTHLPPQGGGLSVRGLFALGLAGGMVPSVSAIILLLGSIAMGRPAYGVALTLAFGVGMATVLVGVGVILVRARGLLERLPSGRARMRIGRLLPAVTPAVMLVAGVLITSQAVFAIR